MASADKDGRIAQAFSDRMACLAMEINESLRDSLRTLIDSDIRLEALEERMDDRHTVTQGHIRLEDC